MKPAMQVRSLEFNGLSPNLLASGGSDGELCIWDVAVPSAPNLYPGLKARALILNPKHTVYCDEGFANAVYLIARFAVPWWECVDGTYTVQAGSTLH